MKTNKRRVESLIKRIENIEGQSGTKHIPWIVEYPDGRILNEAGGPADPAEVAAARFIIRWVAVQPAPAGGPMTEEDLEAKFPGRRERLAEWERSVEAHRRGANQPPQTLLSMTKRRGHVT
jgi:hypothetical protein